MGLRTNFKHPASAIELVVFTLFLLFLPFFSYGENDRGCIVSGTTGTNIPIQIANAPNYVTGTAFFGSMFFIGTNLFIDDYTSPPITLTNLFQQKAKQKLK